MSETAIPDDIRELAVTVVNRGYDEGLVDAVARALLAERAAERERSAGIADDTTRTICRGQFGLIGPGGIGRAIAAAIRTQEDPK